MNNKNILLTICIFFVILFACSALAVKESTGAFSVEIKQITDKITMYGEAKLSINVENKLSKEDTYTLKFGDLTQWPIYYTDPHTDYMSGFNVPSKASYTTKAYFRPDKEIGKGYRNVYITVKSKASSDKLEFAIPIYILSLSEAEKRYLPNVRVTFDFPEKIDPRDEQKLKVTLQNLNIKHIPDLEIHVESNSINFYNLTSLTSEQTKTLVFPIKLDPLQPPEKDFIKVKVNTGPYVFNSERKAFEIIDYTTKFSKKEELATSLLKKEKITTYTNIGNTEKTQTIRAIAPFWRIIFVSAYPKDYSIVREEGVRYYSWDLTLQPMEEKSISIVTNHRIILYLIILILIAISAYYMFRSPIQITKIAKNIELHKGVISEVKVMLNIRNISNQPLEHVKVLDKIPNMANITQDFDIGTVKPSKIMKHESQGYTLVKWDLEELDPNEDRLITYRMKSKLSIFGNFELPRCKVKFKTKTGKKRVVRSNKLVIRA